MNGNGTSGTTARPVKETARPDVKDSTVASAIQQALADAVREPLTVQGAARVERIAKTAGALLQALSATTRDLAGGVPGAELSDFFGAGVMSSANPVMLPPLSPVNAAETFASHAHRDFVSLVTKVAKDYADAQARSPEKVAKLAEAIVTARKERLSPDLVKGMEAELKKLLGTVAASPADDGKKANKAKKARSRR